MADTSLPKLKRIGDLPSGVQPAMGPPTPSYQDEAGALSKQYGLDPELTNRLINQESRWHSKAVSPKGAIGLTQLMPGTAADEGVNPNDPRQNIQGGIQHFARLMQKYKDPSRALAAYNAGEKVVDSGGPWPEETVNYVNSIMAGYKPPQVQKLRRIGDLPDQSMLSRAKGAIKSNVGYHGLTAPMVTYQPSQQFQLKHPFMEAGLNTLEGMTSPVNLGLLAGSVATGGVLGELLAAGFTAEQLADVAEKYPDFARQAMAAKTPEEVSRAKEQAAELVLGGAAGALGAKGTVGKDLANFKAERVPLRNIPKEAAKPGVPPQAAPEQPKATLPKLKKIAPLPAEFTGKAEGLYDLRPTEQPRIKKAMTEQRPLEETAQPLVNGPATPRQLTPQELAKQKLAQKGGKAIDWSKTEVANAPKVAFDEEAARAGIKPTEQPPKTAASPIPSQQEPRTPEAAITPAESDSPTVRLGKREFTGNAGGDKGHPVYVNDKEVARAFFSPNGDDLYVSWLGSPKGGERANLGRAVLRAIAKQALEQYPGTKHISWEHISGARAESSAKTGELPGDPPISKLSAEKINKPPKDDPSQRGSVSFKPKAPSDKIADQPIKQYKEPTLKTPEKADSIQGLMVDMKKAMPSQNEEAFRSLLSKAGSWSEEQKARAKEMWPNSDFPSWTERYKSLTEGQRGSISFAKKPPSQVIGEQPEPLSTKDFKDYLGFLQPITTEEAASRTLLREKTGDLARKKAVIENQLKTARAKWQTRKIPEFHAFVDMIEDGEADRAARGVKLSTKNQAMLDAGKARLTPEDKVLAQQLKQLYAEGAKSVQKLGTGKLETLKANYFAHLWEQPGKFSQVKSRLQGKRLFAGPASFLKERSVPTVMEGVDRGLKPSTYNPIDATIAKLHEMNRFVMAHQYLQNAKKYGLAKYLRTSQKPPDGWVKLKDPMFTAKQYSETEKGFVERGRYYMPKDAAKIINRYTEPGLHGRPLYDLLRGAGNSLNMVQLGLAGFHGTLTGINAIVSRFAEGVKMAAPGTGWSAARAAKGVGKIASSPLAFIDYYRTGKKIAQAYLNPKAASEYARIADGIATAGGRVGMEKVYGNNALDNMINSWKQGKVGKAGLGVIPSILEWQAKPIMGKVVPYMKLGAFNDMAAETFSRADREHWSEEQLKATLQKHWDSVDNRFGQVVYDNLAWNRITKDLLHLGVRAVGWNYGTWRELGGGVGDTFKELHQLYKGKGFEVTDRMAYTFALPVVVGMLGAIYQFMHTGEWPNSEKDGTFGLKGYFWPRNGRTTPNGHDERIGLPSYMKDVYAYAHAPVSTALNKLNPLIEVISESLNNQDFYGKPIRHVDDSMVQNLISTVKFLLKQAEPISIQNLQERAKSGGGVGSAVESLIGASPAPKYIQRTPEENKSLERYRELRQEGIRPRADSIERARPPKF